MDCDDAEEARDQLRHKNSNVTRAIYRSNNTATDTDTLTPHPRRRRRRSIAGRRHHPVQVTAPLHHPPH
jgi:hypothetical protein